MTRLTTRQRAAAIVLSMLALGFIALDSAGGSLQSAHGGVRGVLGSLYRGTDSVLGPVRRFVQAVPHAASDQRRMQALQDENAQLRRQLADERLDRGTARQLRRLQLAATSGNYTVLPARVIATDAAEGFAYTVTIDAGSGSGIRVGQSVSAGDALVGRVIHADSSSSVVLLAVDGESGVGVRDQRSGELGVATGAGHDGFTFRPLDPNATVRVGDSLATGPAGASSFVAGLTLGTVTAVRVAADGGTVASVTPSVSPSALDLLGVIVSGGSRAGTRTVVPSASLAGGR